MNRTTNIEYTKDDNEQSEYSVFSQTIPKNTARKKSESICMELIEQCDGVLCSFSAAIPQLVYFDKKQRRRVAWNCDLEIGENFSIKIAAYIFVSEIQNTSCSSFETHFLFLIYFIGSRRERTWIVEVS